MTAPHDIAAAIAEAARTMNQHSTLEQTLAAIAQAAKASMPGIDEVGISIMEKGGHVETKAATAQLVHTLDTLQYDLGEGPCVETLRDAYLVLAPQIRHDQRWPRYVPAAVACGLRAQLAVRLYLDDKGTLGGLNCYSTTSEEIHPDAEPVAELFATHAAIALDRARELDTLNQGLHSRKVIGQAIGILMERYDMDEDRAFAFLVRASSTSNIKLREVADEVVKRRKSQK